MANGVGVGALATGFLQGYQWGENLKDQNLRRKGVEQEQALRQLDVDRANEARALEKEWQGQYATRFGRPQAETAPQAAISMSDQGITPENAPTAADFAARSQAIQTQAAPKAYSMDDMASELEAKTQFFRTKGRDDLAKQTYAQLLDLSGKAFQTEMGHAARRYAVTQDPREFLPAYKWVKDGYDIPQMEPTDPNDFSKPWIVTASRDGKTATKQVPREMLDASIKEFQDPGAMAKRMLDRADKVFSANLEAQKNAAVENVKGQWKVLEEAIKAGKMTPEQVRHNQEVLAARSYLSSMGIINSSDPRLQETLPGGIKNDKYDQTARDYWKKAGEALIGIQDQSLAAASKGQMPNAAPTQGAISAPPLPAQSTPAPARQPAPRQQQAGSPAPVGRQPSADAAEYLRANPSLRAQFDAKYGQGAADQILGPQDGAAPTLQYVAPPAVPITAQNVDRVLAQGIAAGPRQPSSQTIARRAEAAKVFETRIDAMSAREASKFKNEYGALLDPQQIRALNLRISGVTKPVARTDVAIQ